MPTSINPVKKAAKTMKKNSHPVIFRKSTLIGCESPSSSSQESLRPGQVFRGVHLYGILNCFHEVDGEAVLQGPELLQFFRLLPAAGRLDEGTALLLGVLPPLPPGARVLDFGCGSGAIGAAALAASPGLAVTMLDNDAVALEAVRENVPDARRVLGVRLADVRLDAGAWAAAALALLPDIDGLFMRLIPYEAPWGHRGVTHSLTFAAVAALATAAELVGKTAAA